MDKQALLTLILVVQALMHVGLSNVLFFADEGHYLTYAWLVNEGGVIYKDFFDHHSPGISFLGALGFSVLGKTIFTGRMLALAAQIGITLVVFYITKKITDENTALVSATLYGLLELAFGGFWFITEPFFALFTALAFLSVFENYWGKKDRRLLFFAGVFLGMALVFKQSALWPAIGLAAFIVWKERKNAVMPGIALAVGCTIPLVLTGAYFAVNNALDEFVYGIFTYNFFVIGGKTIGIAEGLHVIWLIPILASTLLSLYTLKQNKDERMLFLLTWFAFAALDAFPEYRFNRLVPCLAPIAILVAMSYKEQKIRKIIKSVLSGLVIFSTVFLLMVMLEFSALEDAGFEVADHIKERTSNDETIFAMRFMPKIYFFAERKPATYYLFFLSSATTPEMEARTIQELEEAKPRYAVLHDELTEKGCEAGFYAPAVYDYLLENYEIEKSFGDYSGSYYVLRRSD